MVFPVAVLFLEEITNTLGDIGLVLVIMSFCYLTFWAMQSFRDNLVILTLSLAVMGYLAATNPIILVGIAVLVQLMFSGNSLQMAVQFGVEPVLGAFGVDVTGREFQQKQHEEYMQHRQKEAEFNVMSGNYNEDDLHLYHQAAQQQQMMQQQQDPSTAQPNVPSARFRRN